ncbi:uncharacterized protein [Lolium perenne]|jgi:hypothetical protein|uniref:uncharacterized protein n=1 Tax=Lolium perenne TaxID=4522 RepID=UPI0021EAE796|nr:uncharacterized protein LOC127298303 [Lolium perenne]
MPSLNHNSLFAAVLERQPQLAHLLASKMKIGKAPEILKKAVTFCKSKSGVLVARFLVLASFRRRMATVGSISHRVHALVAAADREKRGRVDCHKALMLRNADKQAVHGAEIVVNLSRQLALFDQENEHDGGCPDWTLHPIFNENSYCCYIDECDGDEDDDGAHEDVVVEPSVMDVIRNNREVEGLEFNFDNEIDQAADMFITRFRNQMNRSF